MRLWFSCKSHVCQALSLCQPLSLSLDLYWETWEIEWQIGGYRILPTVSVAMGTNTGLNIESLARNERRDLSCLPLLPYLPRMRRCTNASTLFHLNWPTVAARLNTWRLPAGNRRGRNSRKIVKHFFFWTIKRIVTGLRATWTVWQANLRYFTLVSDNRVTTVRNVMFNYLKFLIDRTIFVARAFDFKRKRH